MSTHSVAEARNQLSRLIDRALEGEPVVITRHGHPVVELRPVSKGDRRPPNREAKETWLATRRVRLRGQPIDAQSILRDMRDED
jgi:prevent-host-death family protein